MAVRYYICPVVSFSIADPDGGPDDTGRAPKLRTIIEPGRGKNYQYSAAIAAGNWCLVYVRANDFSALDSDPELINVTEALDLPANVLDQTPRQLGWNAARLGRIRQRAIDKGVDTAGLTLDSTLEAILLRVCQRIAPYFHPRRLAI